MYDNGRTCLSISLLTFIIQNLRWVHIFTELCKTRCTKIQEKN